MAQTCVPRVRQEKYSKEPRRPFAKGKTRQDE